jgi:hypothetical protein
VPFQGFAPHLAREMICMGGVPSGDCGQGGSTLQICSR